MENLIIAVNAVLPMFLIIGLGVLVRQSHIISAEAVRQANGMCFKVFISILLFYNVYTSDLSSSFNGKLLAFCVLGILAEFLAGALLVPRITKEPPARGVMLQAFFRTNIVLLAVPIITSLFGPESMGQAAVLLAVAVPLVHVLSVVALEMHRGGRPSPKKILRGVAANPLVLGALAGILALAVHLRLPAVVESAVRSVANAATPLALVLMGASLDFSKLRSSVRNLSICVVSRLIVNPALLVTLAAALGFRGVALGIILLVFAAPVAVNSYTMALQMDGDANLAGGIVLLTTALSCFTLFLWIWLLKSLGLF